MSDDKLIQLLRAVKLRPTISRISVMRVLDTAGGEPLSADDLFRRLMEQGERCNIGTVYRTLQQCEGAGMLLRAWDDAQRRSVYRIRQGDAGGPAVCLLCRGCDRSFALDDALLYEHLARVMQQHGVRVADQAVQIEITCAACARIGYAS